ncbi:MAG: GDSL-type esterase/lipase family protein, partial [bacterium]
MRRNLVNLLVVALACALSLALGEVVVRALYKEQTVLFPRYHTDFRYGQYTLRGIRPDSEFWHTSADGSWRFVTNDRGFRDVRRFTYAKPAGTLRVLSLGDSQTQGYEVRQEATFSAVLERYLSGRGLKAEVLNAGVSGFSTAEELAFLENEGYKYEPDVVVLGFYANDFEDNLRAGLFTQERGQLVERKYEHIPGVRIQNVIYGVPGVRWL